MKEKLIEFDNYTMRLLEITDLDKYYKYGFEESDAESDYYTGTLSKFTRDQIQQYLKRITVDNTRYDFLITSADELIGEVVINDIDELTAHYRICIFKKQNYSKGIGYKATLKVLEFAFEELGLESIDLEVYPFNKRGIGLYKKLGFEIEKNIIDEEAQEPYRDIIVMKLFKDNFSG